MPRKRRKPVKVPFDRKYPALLTLPFVAGARGQLAAQQRAYEENVGRTWDEVDPAPSYEDFGGPAPIPMPESGLSQAWRPTRAEQLRENKRLSAEMAVRARRYQEEFMPAMDAWKDSPGYAAWQAAYERWYERREQFDYSPRARNAREVIEKARVSA